MICRSRSNLAASCIATIFGSFDAAIPMTAESVATVAAGINSSGHIVGRYLSAEDNQFHGFLLADGEFTTIDYPGAMAMNGIAINNKGDIAGYYGNSDGRSHAFVLRDRVFTTIDPPDSLGTGQNGGVIGINPRHRLVDGTETTQPEFSFWFTDAGWGVENYGTDPTHEVDVAPQPARMTAATARMFLRNALAR